jgi:Family of unknown function (DUF6502)
MLAIKWDTFSLMNSDNPLPQRDHLRRVLRALLVPLVRLAMAHGVKFQDLADVLKVAYVDAGREALGKAGQRVNASTLSVSTGLHRKDLAHFLTQDVPQIDAEPPLEAKVFARWTTDARFLDEHGQPLSLGRSIIEDDPVRVSFEELARTVTTDVRPRAVLESMLRLGLVELVEDDHIQLSAEQLIPSRSADKMLNLLRDNARDHLSAAVANTLGKKPGFLEQSMFAHGLSADSSEKVHQAIRRRWLGLTQALVPQIQRAIDEDKPAIKAGKTQSTRLRVGLYFYSEPENKDKAS